MKKLSLITTIYIVLSLLFVIGNSTVVMAAPDRILEPSFETVANWTFSQNDSGSDYSGALSIVWKTQGTYSFMFSSTATIDQNAYAQIAQSGVNFDLLDAITFDSYLYSARTGDFKASVYVGLVEVWTKDCTTTATAYPRERVDVSTYEGTQDLIFRITCLKSGGSSKDQTNYFDNIKIWGSHSDAAWTLVENNFAGATNHAYMYGENFDAGTTKVGWYDFNGDWMQTDTAVIPADGILDWSECDFPTFEGVAAAGDWHAVVIKTADDLPPNYDAAVLHANFVAEDVFNVAASAIPEFPEVMAAIGVAGFCFGIYWWMRKRVHETPQTSGEGR